MVNSSVLSESTENRLEMNPDGKGILQFYMA